MKAQWWQLGTAVIGIIAVEFRKEEDKEETAWGSDLHLCSNPAHISHRCPGTAGYSDRQGRIRHRQSIGCQPQPVQHITQHCCQQRKRQLLCIPLPYSWTACDISSTSSAVNTFSIHDTLYFRHNRKNITRRWHSSALLFCVKSEEAIGDPSAKTRQRHKLLLAGNRCLRESWHSTTILLLTEINKRNTRDTAWLSPNERETLKYTGRLACKHFLILHPQNIWLLELPALVGQGWIAAYTTSTARRLLIRESKAEPSCRKYGRGVCSPRERERKKRKKIHQANSSDPSAKSHMLLTHTVHAPVYTQANIHTHTHTRIQIQDVGSQFSKHSPYPLLL